MRSNKFKPKTRPSRAAMLEEIAALVSVIPTSLDMVLDSAAATICRTMADSCVIGLLSDVGDAVHPVGFYHCDPKRRAQANAAEDLDWEPVGGPSETALSTGEPVLLASVDIAAKAVGRAWAVAFYGDCAPQTVLVLAMRALGTDIGVMVLARDASQGSFVDEDVSSAQDVAGRLALAVLAIQLQEQLNGYAALGRGNEDDPSLAALTARELEIFRAIQSGLTSRETGERLFLSVRTVEWHRARLMIKLGASSRSELIALGRVRAPGPGVP